jgi:RNA-directed DNA polymerase
VFIVRVGESRSVDAKNRRAGVRGAIVAPKPGNAGGAKGSRKMDANVNTRLEVPPSPVPSRTQQDGDVLSRWSWTEQAVWTERMLTALEQGVKGGCWFRLMDKVFAERNLSAAYAQVARNKGAPGVDHVTVGHFGDHLESELPRLSQQLRDGTYRPQAVRRVHIPKPGSTETRPLGIPTVRDRVVQAAVVNVIEPIFEREFAEHSYGFRPGRGCKDGLRRVDQLLKAGYHFVVDADLKSYFDTIPHDHLMTRLRERIADGSVLSLIEQFLKAGILDGMTEWTPEAGAPQGAVLSPLLSNIYLNPLDHMMAQSGFEMVRYADDFVILCRTAAEAEQALEIVRDWVAGHGLTLHPTKTKIVDVRTDGFEFLGYRFVKHRRFPRKKSMQKFKDSIRKKTKRNRGVSLECIIADVNRSLRGWFLYFQHSHHTTFRDVDKWVRGRLRSILRRRTRRRGRARGSDHQRWPNAFFVRLGLSTLETAHALAVQSSRR